MWAECVDLVIVLRGAWEWRQGDTGFRMRGANRAVKMGIEKGNGNSSPLVCNLCNVVWSIQRMHSSFIQSKCVRGVCVPVVKLCDRERLFSTCVSVIAYVG